MPQTVDIWHLENTHAALLRIMSYIDMLREHTEPNATDQAKEYKPEFELITLNLLNLHELVYQLNKDITETITAAYQKAEG